MSSAGPARVERLRDDHRTEAFDSGAPELDLWLRREALNSERRDAARVYVVPGPAGEVLAYSALVAGTAGSDELPRSASGGMTNVPVVLLGKLAVDVTRQSSGLGTVLLRHAVRTALDARARIALRLLVVDARDETAHAWYRAKGLVPLSNSLRLYARLHKLG